MDPAPSGDVTVCLPDTGLDDSALYHLPDGLNDWTRLPAPSSSPTGFVCGVTGSFSDFAVGLGVPSPSGATPPASEVRHGYTQPVVGEPLQVMLDNRDTDYLARIQATTREQEANPSVGCSTGGTRGSVAVPAWQWQVSDDYTDDSDDSNDTWTDISEDGGATYVYVPVATDATKYLRATLTFGPGDSATATTPALGPVLASVPSGVAAAAGSVTIGGTAQVGETLTAGLTAAGATEVGRWQWERSDDGSTGWTNVTKQGCDADGPAHQYALTSAEQGKYLRAYVYYNDADGNRKRAEAAGVGPVAAQ